MAGAANRDGETGSGTGGRRPDRLPLRALGFTFDGAPRRLEEEPKRVLGVPVDQWGPVDVEWLRSMLHPLRSVKRWRRRRRAGPFLDEEDLPRRA